MADSVGTSISFVETLVRLNVSFRLILNQSNYFHSKIRFVFRTFGLDGLRKYIRQHNRLAEHFISLIGKDERFEIVFTAPVQLGLVCFRLKNKSNEINERLLKALNDDKRIYLVPSMVKQKFILRLAVCSWLTEEKHIEFAWKVIDEVASKLLKDENSPK